MEDVTPSPQLTAIEARILGCLIEKEITLPDYYPLTLNALVSACNQTTNRDPIMSLDEGAIQRALENMKTRGWVYQVTVVGARVQKFRHNLKGKLPRLEKPGIALLTVLLLRGAQTVGELRQRTERLHSFPDLESVEAQLTDLISFPEGPLAACLPAGPGRRVALYAQLLTGEPSGIAPQEEVVQISKAIPASADDQAWKERMELEIELLKSQLSRLKTKLGIED
ncbi:MAG: YceH family protein [Prosthecobacter sp.]|nr:YceH family protein [Prosthecobacter sp.]